MLARAEGTPIHLIPDGMEEGEPKDVGAAQKPAAGVAFPASLLLLELLFLLLMVVVKVWMVMLLLILLLLLLLFLL